MKGSYRQPGQNAETIKKDALIAKAKVERERKKSKQNKINWLTTTSQPILKSRKTKRVKTQNKAPSKKQILPKLLQMLLKDWRQKCNVVTRARGSWSQYHETEKEAKLQRVS